MGYRIGLDIGITSVGYAILKTDEKGSPYKIEHLTSVIFPIAENPKDGKSLAMPRREQRGARRRNRRTKFRKHRTKMLFVRSELLTIKQIEAIYSEKQKLSSIYELRTKALNERLTNEELFRILYFFSGHRGFKSNRKSELTEKDMGPVLTAIKDIEEKLADGTYRTLGEYMELDEKYQEHKRNKDGIDRYLGTAKRSLIEDEIKQIIIAQQQFGNTKLTSGFQVAFIGDEEQTGIFNDQREFEDGPGKQSPYAGNQIEKMIGACTFEENEKRAPKASYTFQYFDFLCKLNNLKYRETIGGEYRFLSLEQKNVLKEKVLTTQKITFSGVKKLLDLPEHAQFNLVNYGTKSTVKETETKSVFYAMISYHKLKKAIPAPIFSNLSTAELDEIGRILTLYSSDKGRKNEFYSRLAIPEEVVEALLPINFSKFGNLSLKAMRKIIPYLEMGLVYSEAATQAGYDFRHKKIDQAYIHENVTNPVVKRAASQTIKIVNNIIRKYGEPDGINIELARELSKNFSERKKTVKYQEENRARNERIADKLRECELPVNGANITRLKLFEEQGKFDPYTGLKIPFDRAFSEEYEVDHIIPYSKTLDDSYGNKILVSAKANQEKGNRIPMEYLQGKPERIKKLESITATIKNPKKCEKLLKQQLTKEDVDGWKTRNLNDTRYISSLLHDYFNQNISFAKLESEKKKRVIAVNGAITSKLRARWGFNKIRENGDEHHALDALIVACVTDKYIKEITSFSKRKEVRFNENLWKREKTPQEIEQEVVHFKKDYDRIFNQAFPLPWTNFREEVSCRMSENPAELMKNHTWETYTDDEIAALRPIFIVRMPNMKTSGPAHQETIRSGKLEEKGLNISRVSIEKLKLDKEGTIKSGNAQFYKDSGNGWQLLHDKLKVALEKHDGDGSKAFPDGVFKYQYLDKEHTVRKVRLVAKSTLQTSLNEKKSVADNGSMIRIDVFRNEQGKYQFVPIYAKDRVAKKLPNQAVAVGKIAKEWPLIEESDFKFSLYSNDLIRVKHKKGVKHVSKDGNKEEKSKTDFFGYYTGADIATASISGISPNNFFEFRSMGLATLISIEKYKVDYFGNYHQVNEKVRQKFPKNRM
ncbi:type II CRISPR RNA-guided endonuclease Cas9 [Carnobacterium divergens]|uniref:type II CRISPR RNA-guided endonuclease Cas9 n=1 Tax=Carnobacterium divergens TaxID=2748 RepID=UPI00128D6BEB|nr:type II CRISPR RNA-guided endonuclease Cas9 [Carnobacterium divergens]MPQ22378.1 type II CRISPR RNA-guided endonuclease Cas9 [Carnobacterium divergens]